METNETVLKEIDFMQIGGFKVGHAGSGSRNRMHGSVV